MTEIASKRLKRLSRWMRYLCIALIIIVILAGLYAASGWFFDRSALGNTFPNVRFSPDTVSAMARAGIILVNGITVFFVCRGLLALSKLFRAFERDEALTAFSSQQLRSAGVSFLVVAIYGVLARTLSVLILTFGNPAGQRSLAIGFGSNELFAILLAGTLLAVGHVLTVATHIAEENKGFV